MVALNFHARFAPAVAQGEKRQTIRARGKRPAPAPGQQLQLYTGMRTSSCRKLRDAVCSSVTPIDVQPRHSMVRLAKTQPGGGIALVELQPHEIEDLAKRDGFAGTDEFFAYFAETHKGGVSGYLIMWEV